MLSNLAFESKNIPNSLQCMKEYGIREGREGKEVERSEVDVEWNGSLNERIGNPNYMPNCHIRLCVSCVLYLESSFMAPSFQTHFLPP